MPMVMFISRSNNEQQWAKRKKKPHDWAKTSPQTTTLKKPTDQRHLITDLYIFFCFSKRVIYIFQMTTVANNNFKENILTLISSQNMCGCHLLLNL